MAEQFRVRVVARGYEIDLNAHVAGTVLLQYGQHARWECLRAAGVDIDAIRRSGLGPVSLEEHIRFHRELHAGDEVEVSCRYEWGQRKTFTVTQDVRHLDGTLVAEITTVGGLLDQAQRRLVSDPASRWRDAATTPELLNLAPRTS